MGDRIPAREAIDHAAKLAPTQPEYYQLQQELGPPD
jgi:hypothetical protein